MPQKRRKNKQYWLSPKPVLLAEDMDPTMHDLLYPDSIPRLSRAVASGDLDEMKRLLAKKCSPRMPDNRGYTTIHYCVLAGQFEFLRIIIKRTGKNLRQELVNLVNWKEESPLYFALSMTYPNIKIVKLLLKSGACPNRIPPTKVTPLHLACSRRGNLVFVQLLVNHGANVNEQVKYKSFTPLHVAVLKGQDLDMIEYLARLSDLTLVDDYGETAFQTALSLNWVEAVNIFLKIKPTLVHESAELSPLAYAGFFGNIAMTDALISAGIPVNAPTKAVIPSRSPRKEMILLDWHIFYPLHSTLSSLTIFEKILRLTDPCELLKTNHYYYGFPIFVMCYGGPRFYEVLLQSHYPKELKTVTVETLVLAILKFPELRHLLLEKFVYFFKYSFNFDPRTFFRHFSSQVTMSSIARCFDFFYKLAQMGISPECRFECNGHVICLLENCVLSCNDPNILKQINSTTDLLAKTVPTLQQCCRLVVRKAVGKFHKDNWSAFTFIRNNENLPRKVKKFLLYDILKTC